MKRTRLKKLSNSLLILCYLAIHYSTSFGQCSVIGPPNVSINCGSSTTLAATTNAVSYSVVASACTPVAIAGTNAFPVTCDDCVTGQIPIGFNFNFYGNIYSSAVISSNGLLGFGPFTFTGYTPFAIPAGGLPNNYIAGFMCDIDIRYGGTITYQTVGIAPNRRFVVSYNNVVPYNMGSSAGTGTASFQIILNESGSFQVVVSQLSANWNASTSGALATSGAENIDGTLAFPVPGRNATDWPGITPGQQDCYLFNPVPCIFQRWELAGTTMTTNPNYTVSPTTTTTYTGVWNCGGSVCTYNTVVSLNTTLTMGSPTMNTNCSTPNGAIAFTTTGFADGNYTLNYTLNGTPTSATVTVTAGSFTLGGLNAGNYANFVLGTAGCTASVAGPTAITSPTLPTSTGVVICQGGSGTISTSSCGVAGITTAQGAVFNSGSLTAADPTWNRNSSGTFCSATAGTSYYYDVYSFTVSTAGSYTFAGCFPVIDSYGSLYQNAFNGAAPCGTPTDHIISDDDGNGALCSLDPLLTATLSPGITYYIVSTSFSSLVTDTYSWTFTGPPGATISTGTGSTIQWYTAPTGGTSISSNNPLNPVGVVGSGLANTNTPGTYTYYSACSASPTCRTATTFVISANSVPPTSISGVGNICQGTSATLSVVGGSLAVGATWQWYTGSCGGTLVGTGNSITVSPTTTTTYYVRASAGTSCPASACTSGTVTLPPAGTTLANNTDAATCVVNQNGYVHFYHSSGRLIASINSFGQNLGNVTAVAYTGAPVNMDACNAPGSSYMATALGRHWLITPQFQPATPIDVVLHFDQSEYTTLQTAANGNISPYDNLTGIVDLKLSKYSGPLNVDAFVTNNCVGAGGSGGTTLHNQAANGNITTLLPGFSATGRYTRHSIPGFSELWLHGSMLGSPLPVELISFNVNCEIGNASKISWSTASESFCDTYIVERSGVSSDWTPIAEVNCSGNSTVISNYEVIDPERISGTSYYRLKQIDLNGDVKIFDAVSVTCNSDEWNIVTYPNPAESEFSVLINCAKSLGDATVVLTDVSGKLISERGIDLIKGQTVVPFETTGLSDGTYFIEVRNELGQFSPVKIIIQK